MNLALLSHGAHCTIIDAIKQLAMLSHLYNDSHLGVAQYLFCDATELHRINDRAVDVQMYLYFQ